MKFHQLSELFPMMSDKELNSLAEDIKKNGLQEPITIKDKTILDGRNRFKACSIAKVEPEFKEFNGKDALSFIISKNLSRRHLNESQRAMIAEKLATWSLGDNQYKVGSSIDEPISRKNAAKMLNVSTASLDRAREVKEMGNPELVSKVERGEIAVSVAARKVNREKKLGEIEKGNKPFPDGSKTYSIVYADPPWEYDFSPSDSRSIQNHYPTMELEKILSLPVQKILAGKAMLFLWCPPSFVKKGIMVLEAWGFEYRTNMIWVKDRIGAGQWVRQRHEMLLIGRKGDFPTPEQENRHDSVIESPRQEHSKKPEIFYEIIEKMYPNISRIELFARQKHPGWDVWGNQI